MSTTPEDFLAQATYLAAPEPFTPSVFIDLPPTPLPDADADDDRASSDDLVLPFISQMLMEQDIHGQFFYQFPDHPALLNTQHILSADSAAASSRTGGSSTLSPFSSAAAAPTSPYSTIELSHLLRSPPYSDMGARPDDFTAFFSPGQDHGGAAGFQNSLAFFDTVGGGGGGGAPQNADGLRRQRGSLVAQDGGGGAGIQTEATTLPAGGDDDHAALASAFFGARNNGGNMDSLNMAFLKGMEEAKKFLPTTNNLLIDLDLCRGSSNSNSSRRGRKNRHAEDEEEDLEAETTRSTKVMMMPEQEEEEEAGATELYNEVNQLMACDRDYEALLKHMKDLRIAMDSESEKSARRVMSGNNGAWGRQHQQQQQQHGNEVVDLRAMLIHCAQSVATGDRRSAFEVLAQIKQHSSPRGDATQRLAHCFAEGLEARLAGTGSQVYRSLTAQRTSVVEFLKAYRLFMAASCLKKVKIMFSNMAICDAVAGKSKLHIVEYGVQHGFQYPGLLQLLAKREGGPPEVRFTGIAVPQPGFRPALQMEETGRRLSKCAREFGVPFRFRGIAAKWETVRAKDLKINPDEVLVVNSESFIGHIMDESVLVDSPSPRDMVLKNIREMKPDVFILSVVNGTHGAPFFLTRFREALFFYSALFDMLDATIPRDNDERLLIERGMLGKSALNVIACEGADRVERPETYRQWQARNHRAGLRQLPLNPEVVKAASDKVKNFYHRDFLIDVDNHWMLLVWKGRVIHAMSTWAAENKKTIF